MNHKLTGFDLINAKDQLGRLCPSCPYQSRKAHDLSLSHLDAHVLNASVPILQVLCLQRNLLLHMVITHINLRHIPAHHHLDQLLVGFLSYPDCPDPSSVPHDCDPVSDLAEFLHSMGYINNSDSLCL